MQENNEQEGSKMIAVNAVSIYRGILTGSNLLIFGCLVESSMKKERETLKKIFSYKRVKKNSLGLLICPLFMLAVNFEM